MTASYFRSDFWLCITALTLTSRSPKNWYLGAVAKSTVFAFSTFGEGKPKRSIFMEAFHGDIHQYDLDSSR